MSLTVLQQFSAWNVFLRGKWVTATFVTNYIALALFPITYLLARWWKGKGPVRPEDMDFVSGVAEVLAASCVACLM